MSSSGNALFDDADGNGAFSRSVDTSSVSIDVGCRYYHPEHDHYHVEAFARYSLQSVATGAIARSAGKISFCVADTDPFNLRPARRAAVEQRRVLQRRDMRDAPLDPGDLGRLVRSLRLEALGTGDRRHGHAKRRVLPDRGGRPRGSAGRANEANNAHRRQLSVNPAAAPSTGYVTLPSSAGCEIGEPPPPPSTALLRPNATVTSQWRVFGASSPWAAIDDALVPPAKPGATDYIRPTGAGQATEVGLNRSRWAPSGPGGRDRPFFGKTYRGDTSLRVRVYWGGQQQETYTVNANSAYAWRQVAISPAPPTQAALDDLSVKFTRSTAGHHRPRCVVEVGSPDREPALRRDPAGAPILELPPESSSVEVVEVVEVVWHRSLWSSLSFVVVVLVLVEVLGCWLRRRRGRRARRRRCRLVVAVVGGDHRERCAEADDQRGEQAIATLAPRLIPPPPSVAGRRLGRGRVRWACGASGPRAWRGPYGAAQTPVSRRAPRPRISSASSTSAAPTISDGRKPQHPGTRAVDHQAGLEAAVAQAAASRPSARVTPTIRPARAPPSTPPSSPRPVMNRSPIARTPPRSSSSARTSSATSAADAPTGPPAKVEPWSPGSNTSPSAGSRHDGADG